MAKLRARLFFLVIIVSLTTIYLFYPTKHYPACENPLLSPINQGINDWKSYLGPNANFKSSHKISLDDWRKGLELIWSIDYLCHGNKKIQTWSAPVIQGNRLIVMGRDNTHDFVFCIHTDTGKPIWVQSYEALNNDMIGMGARATPLISENHVYTLGKGGHFYCWDLLDGQFKWSVDLVDLGGEIPSWGYSGSPLSSGNMIFTQPGGKHRIVALSKKTGEIIWTSGQGSPGYSSLLPAQILGQKTIISFAGEEICALNEKDGEIQWSFPWKTNAAVNASLPVVHDDLVIFSSAYSKGMAAIKIFKQENKYQVNLEWKNRKFQAHHHNPVLLDHFVYGFSGKSEKDDGVFMCVDILTGEIQWETSELGIGNVLMCDNYLIALNNKGVISILNPNPKVFERLLSWENAFPDRKELTWVAPVIANNKLYLRDQEYLYCYSLLK